MRVVLFESSSRGGLARYAADLARGLAVTASPIDEVELVAPRDFPYEGNGYVSSPTLVELRGARRGGKAVNLGALLVRHSLQVAGVTRRIRETSPAIVHVLNTGLLGSSVVRQTARAESRLVATVHDLPVSIGDGTPKSRTLLIRWSKRLPDADLIVVHGTWSADHLKAAYHDARLPLAVLPLPRFDYGPPTGSTPPIRQRIGIPVGVPLALFFGALRREKGLDVLIEALADPRLTTLHLLVAGERAARSEPSTTSLRVLAEANGVADRIHWLEGYTPDDQIPDLFECADMVVLPYRSTFSGQSAVVSLAATYDVPVVASAVGELEDAIARFSLGRSVPPESPSALATALERTIRQPNRLPTHRAKWPTFDEVAKALWATYRQVATS